MSKIKIFLILSGYQLTWLMCVFGEIFLNNFLPGLISGLLFLVLVFFKTKNKKKLLFIIFLISLVGYTFDTIMVYFEIYNFNTSKNFGYLPIWMLVLWPSFAILFDEVFLFLKNFKLVGILLSASLGPLTYYAGSPLGLIVINQFYLFFLYMVIFWALLMYFYLNYLLNQKFTEV